MELRLEIEDIYVNTNLRWSYEKQKYMQTIFRAIMRIYINTKNKKQKNIIKCLCKIAPNIHEGLMDVSRRRRKNMFNDIPYNHHTQASDHYNPI